MEVLKPCPFCGADSADINCKYGRNGCFVFVQCQICGAESKKFGTGRYVTYSEYVDDENYWDNPYVENSCEKAISAWNLRRCQDAE